MAQQLRGQVRRPGLALDEVGEADHVLLGGVGLGRETSVSPLRDPALASALRSVGQVSVSTTFRPPVREKSFASAFRQNPVFGRLETRKTDFET